nr:MAG TPA: hypothetical protein [Caudoviricetes sp.]
MKILRFLKVWIMDLIKVGSYMRPKKSATPREAGKGFANSAAQAEVKWEDVKGRPTKLSQFENDPHFATTSDLEPLFTGQRETEVWKKAAETWQLNTDEAVKEIKKRLDVMEEDTKLLPNYVDSVARLLDEHVKLKKRVDELEKKSDPELKKLVQQQIDRVTELAIAYNKLKTASKLKVDHLQSQLDAIRQALHVEPGTEDANTFLAMLTNFGERLTALEKKVK